MLGEHSSSFLSASCSSSDSMTIMVELDDSLLFLPLSASLNLCNYLSFSFNYLLCSFLFLYFSLWASLLSCLSLALSLVLGLTLLDSLLSAWLTLVEKPLLLALSPFLLAPLKTSLLGSLFVCLFLKKFLVGFSFSSGPIRYLDIMVRLSLLLTRAYLASFSNKVMALSDFLIFCSGSQVESLTLYPSHLMKYSTLLSK